MPTSAERARNHRRRLQLDARRMELQRQEAVEEMAGCILSFQKGEGRKYLTAQLAASALANHLAKKWRFVKINDPLETILQNCLKEPAAALHAASWDSRNSLMKALSPDAAAHSELKTKKARRVRIDTEKERIQRTKAWKNRYERNHRSKAWRYPNLAMVQSEEATTGTIEEQFGTSTTLLSILDPVGNPPSGACLDRLLHLDYVQMSNGEYCLESLFGVDRHRFPKTIPRHWQGRECYYDIRAVIQCMESLLASGRWLADRDRRRQVLTGIVRRARDVDVVPMLAEALERILFSHLA